MAITIPGLQQVNRIGLGTIHITQDRGFGSPIPNAVELLRHARDRGVNFFDTADSYGPSSAEETLRSALYPYAGLVVATKGGYLHRSVDNWEPARAEGDLRCALEGSLRRLRLDAIHLYMLHTAEGAEPSFEESVGALKKFYDEGKVRAVGVSRVSLAQLRVARAILGAALVAVENCLNIFCPSLYMIPDEPDTLDVLNECEHSGLIFVAWEPLASGPPEFGAALDVAVRRLATQKACSVQQLLLSAVLHRSECVVAIPGTQRIGHVDDNVAAEQVRLTPAEVALLWPYWSGAGLAI